MAKNMKKIGKVVARIDKSFDLALIDKEAKLTASEDAFRNVNLRDIDRSVASGLIRFLDCPFKEYRERFFKKFLKEKHQIEVAELNTYLKLFSGKKK